MKNSLLKFMRFDTEYGQKNLNNKTITVTPTSVLLNRYPEELRLQIKSDLYTTDEDLRVKEEQKLCNHLRKTTAITCFSTSDNFHDERKWKAYGENCIILKFDEVQLLSKIKGFCSNNQLIPYFHKVVYSSETPNIGPFYEAWNDQINKLKETYRSSEEELVFNALKNVSRDSAKIFLSPLYTKSNGEDGTEDFSWEDEFRVIVRKVDSSTFNDYAIIADNLLPVLVIYRSTLPDTLKHLVITYSEKNHVPIQEI